MMFFQTEMILLKIELLVDLAVRTFLFLLMWLTSLINELVLELLGSRKALNRVNASLNRLQHDIA